MKCLWMPLARRGASLCTHTYDLVETDGMNLTWLAIS